MTLALPYIKSQFPIFANRPALVYLDSAATAQKPKAVIDSLTRFYEQENASVHRGLYELSASATDHFEQVRKKVADLINAASPKSIAFTKGATESINIVASGFLKDILDEGDNVLISVMEHHANLIPWQQVCAQRKAELRAIPIDENGDLILEALKTLANDRTKLIAVTHISNVLGTINPLEEIIEFAHRKNIPVLVDGAQSVGHTPVDVVKLDVDFLAFSAHKMFGPLGTGVLYCKEDLQAKVKPLNFGGGSIKDVELDHTEFMDYPYRLEPGTPNVAGIIGMGAAIDFIQSLDLTETEKHAEELTTYFREGLNSIGKIKVLGSPAKSGGIVSFNAGNIHPHDVAGFLAADSIAVRAGHHCAQPLHKFLDVPASVRVSFSIYSTKDDVDKTLTALVELKKFWS